MSLTNTGATPWRSYVHKVAPARCNGLLCHPYSFAQQSVQRPTLTCCPASLTSDASTNESFYQSNLRKGKRHVVLQSGQQSSLGAGPQSWQELEHTLKPLPMNLQQQQSTQHKHQPGSGNPPVTNMYLRKQASCLVHVAGQAGFLSKQRHLNVATADLAACAQVGQHLVEQLTVGLSCLSLAELGTCIWALARMSECLHRSPGSGSSTHSSSASMAKPANESTSSSFQASAARCAHLAALQVAHSLQSQPDLLSPHHKKAFNTNSKGLSQLCWGLAKLGERNPVFWEAAGKAAAVHLQSIAPQAIATILWAFATVGVRHAGLVSATELCLRLRTRRFFQPSGLAMLCWALAELQALGNPAWATLGELAVQLSVTGQMTPDTLTMTAHAFAVAKKSDVVPEFLPAIANTLQQLLLERCGPEELSQMVWALGTALHDDAERKGKLARASASEARYAASAAASGAQVRRGLAVGMTRSMQLRDSAAGRQRQNRDDRVARAGYAGHKQGVPVAYRQIGQGLSDEGIDTVKQALLAASERALVLGLGSFSGPQLSAFARGLQRSGRWPNADVLHGLRDQLLLRASSLPERSLTDLAYAFAKTQYYNEPMWSAVCEAAVQRMDVMSMRGISQLAYSLSEIRHHSPAFMQQAMQQARSGLSSCSPQDYACLAGACATFNHTDHPFITALASAVRKSLDAGQLNTRTCVHLAWAFALLGCMDPELLQGLFDTARAQGLGPLGVQTHMQLFQAQMLVADVYGGIVELPAQFSHKEIQALSRTWRWVTDRSQASSFQQELQQALTHLGVQAQVEYKTLDGLFSIDMALVWRGRRVALEADGPRHFTFSRPHRPLGSTLARWRCLEARGWRVLSVPGHEWAALGGDEEAQQRYLQAALDGALWRTLVLDRGSGDASREDEGAPWETKQRKDTQGQKQRKNALGSTSG